MLNRSRNADCPEGYAYQCYGPNRPEVNNPAVTCGNGLREGDALHYCCQHAPRPSRLRAGQGRHDLHGGLDRLGLPDDADRIPSARRGLRRQREPRGLLLLRVRRADARTEPAGQRLLLLLAVARAARRLLRLQSGSARLRRRSTNADNGITCAPGRFAFACYGRDRPDQDFYPRIKCTEPPVQGMSDTDYDATLYCCDYVPPGVGSGAGTDPNE